MDFFKVLSLNVRGMRDPVKRRVVFDYVGHLRADICFLQEVHLRDIKDKRIFSSEWRKGPSVWSVGGVHSTGVGILFGIKEIKVEEVVVISQGRVLGADILWGSLKLRVIVVYGPQTPAERQEVFGLVESYLATNRQVIVGGDFNVELGRGGTTGEQGISSVMNRYGLVDGGRAVLPPVDGPTWRNSRGIVKRLDYVFFSKSFSLLAGRQLPVCFTDHDGLLFKVHSSMPHFGPGFWRLNISVLDDFLFREQFLSFFRGLSSLRHMSSGVIEWWEAAKERIKWFCLMYCRRKARQARRRVSYLQQRLELAYARGNCGSKVDLQVCDTLKARLRESYEHRARAYLLRSRRDLTEKSETCSAAFFSSIRADREKQIMTAVRDKQGRLVTETDEMLSVTTDHYRLMFKERVVDVEGGRDFLDLLTQRVPPDIAQAMEAPLSLNELGGALRRMNKRKVPGMDGLPVEFYVVFWDVLGPVLLEVLTEVLHMGAMGGSLATGVISLLYKKGDNTDLGNWRPLTMLCVDYKLLAKVLADRLGMALPHVVHVDQTCGVEGRSVRWNLQLIRDAIAWVEDKNLPLMAVALDQAKAFDRVHRGFMFRVLKRMGFSLVFVGWVQALYTNVRSMVAVNGHLGEVFGVHSGVRQGCPLSPLLYILYIEPLAAAIRADRGIKGLLVPGSGGTRVKLSQYADDTTLLLDSDACLIRSLQIIHDFGQVAGASLNFAKSSVKFFGRWRGRTEVPGGLALCPGPLKILGVLFETAHSAASNWMLRLSMVQKKLTLWKSRCLTFVGKVLILKVDVLPSLLYLAYVFPLPVSMRRPLMRLVFNFMWGGRYEYVSRARMLAGIEAGGRDVPHLPLKLDCIFVSSLFTQLSGPVVHPSGYFLRLYFAYQARQLMVWSNLAPRVEQLPWHYLHAARWLRANPEASLAAVKLSHRALYNEVRERVTEPPVVGVPPRIWREIQPRGLDNGLKDLNWLCLHRRLPVRRTMHRHGLAGSPVCPRVGCTEDESVVHVMWDCPFAQEVWYRVRLVFGQLIPMSTMTWDKVDRGVGAGKGKFPMWLIISWVKRNLWLARQELVQKNRETGVQGVMTRVVAEVMERIKRDIMRWGKHAALERWKGGLGLVR